MMSVGVIKYGLFKLNKYIVRKIFKVIVISFKMFFFCLKLNLKK